VEITALRTENLLALAALALLLASGFIVLAPFISALLWAVVVVFSTWGFYTRLLGFLGGRTILAAMVMTLLLTAVLVVPFVAVGMSVGENLETVTAAIRGLLADGVPQAPEWVRRLPLVGATLTEYWTNARADSTQLLAWLQAQAGPASRWLLGRGVAFGQGLLQVVLSVLTAFFLYRDGPHVVTRLQLGLERIAGERAHRLLRVAGTTIRGVVYGIVGTALAQGAVATVGFSLAGIPGPLFLGALTCVLSLIPMGPPLVWIPSVFWLFNQGQTSWGVFLLIWGFFCISGIDNIVKPYLISQESALPFLLVLLGVVGGVLAFGFIGVFLGPVILAVCFALMREWTHTEINGSGSTEVR
jgi:predicted PurR-regulated permease PerM